MRGMCRFTTSAHRNTPVVSEGNARKIVANQIDLVLRASADERRGAAGRPERRIFRLGGMPGGADIADAITPRVQGKGASFMTRS